MTLSKARLEAISLYNYLKYEVLGYSFIEQLSSQALTYDSDLGLYTPSVDGLTPAPNSVGRGWVPFDEVSGSIDVTAEQTSRVSVVGASTYSVNYALGGIENPDTVPTSVSYYWNYVAVVDGWPGSDPPELPIVAIDFSGYGKSGFQLGGGNKTMRSVDIHVFANDSAERSDITEAVYDSLFDRTLSITDYSLGDYLDYDGLYDSSFVKSSLSGVSTMYFDSVSVRNINMPNDWSNLNKFRSVISTTLVYYVF